MKPIKLLINNFFSFGENTELDFSNKGNLILTKGMIANSDNSNGAGKSSLFESIYWCLTGKTVRGATAGDVVKFGKTKVSVSFTFSYNGKIVVVDRIWSASEKRVLLSIDGKVEEFHDSKQGTGRVFEFLGLNEEMFSLLTFYGKNFTKFSALSPKDKADVIDIISKSKMYENAKDLSMKKAKESERLYELSDRDLLNLKEQTERLSEDINRYGMSLNDKKSVLESKKNRIQAELKESKDLLNEFSSGIEKLFLTLDSEEVISDTINKINNDKEVATRSIVEALEKFQAESAKEEQYHQSNLNAHNESNSNLKQERSGILDRLSDLRYQIENTNCIKCGQELPNPPDTVALNAKIEELKKTEQGIVESIKHNEMQVDSLYGTIKTNRQKVSLEVKRLAIQISENGKVFDDHIEKIRQIHRKKSENYQSCLDDKNRLSKKCDSLQNDLDALDRDEEIITINALIKDKESELVRIRSEIEKKAESIKAIAEDIAVAKYWTKGMKELRFSAFEETCNALESLLTSFCENEGLDFDSIKVSPWKEGARGNFIPEISVGIVRGKKTMRLESLSEGEMQRVDLACFFTFSLLIEKTLGFKIDFNVLDEPLTGLDVEGKHNMFSIISSLSEKKQIITIDHDANFNDLFDTVITVNKENGTSYIN